MQWWWGDDGVSDDEIRLWGNKGAYEAASKGRFEREKGGRNKSCIASQKCGSALK